MIKNIAGAILSLAIATAPLSVAAQAGTGKAEKLARSAKKTQPAKQVLRRNKDGSLFNQPVYNPATRSYFELVKVTGPGYRPDLNWQSARAAARKRFWRGVRGHLAIVKSRQVHDFLRITFRSDTIAWIGLRYMCAFNTLLWVNGDIHKRSGFSYWAPVWNRYVPRSSGTGQPVCPRGGRGYWPVQYYPVSEGFRWSASGVEKKFTAYFVEYNTGKR